MPAHLTTSGRRLVGLAALAVVVPVAAVVWPGQPTLPAPPAAQPAVPPSAAVPAVRPAVPAGPDVTGPAPGLEGEGRQASLSPTAATSLLSDRLVPVPGTSRRVGQGRLFRYSVEVQQGLPVDAEQFARTSPGSRARPGTGPGRARRAAATPRRRRSSPGRRTGSARPVDQMCRPLDTAGIYSCFNGTRAMINHKRWEGVADAYAGDLTRYRQYLISHEVGHALDHRHDRCPASAALAPVMVQQTISTQGCRPNPWPFPGAA